MGVGGRLVGWGAVGGRASEFWEAVGGGGCFLF